MSEETITLLLSEWNKGNEIARDELMPLVENELRRIAARYLAAERPDHTLQATALINEAYIKLVDQKDVHWQNRAHFFGIAAQLMRRILVDHARGKNAAKRAGDRYKIALDDVVGFAAQEDADLVALNDALNSLASIDLLKAQIVELKFFGGLTIEETAQVLKVSIDTVKDKWKVAKAWLYRELNKKD